MKFQCCFDNNGIFKINNINKTILHFASTSGNYELVKYLIELNQIDINVKTILEMNFFNSIKN